MIRARTKAQTGNCVFQTSMAITPNTNMLTAKDISFCYIRSLMDVQKTEMYHQSGTSL
jgi:hypothetical protein